VLARYAHTYSVSEPGLCWIVFVRQKFHGIKRPSFLHTMGAYTQSRSSESFLEWNGLAFHTHLRNCGPGKLDTIK
jgi:hypothetical protein